MPETRDNINTKQRIRIAILGECGVGKSSIVKQFVNKTFSEDTPATIGVDRSESFHPIDHDIFSMNILDMAGSRQFQNLITSYLIAADAVVFVYDITDKESFAMLPVWGALVSNYCTRDIVKILVGNKKDLSRHFREVRFQNAQTFANFEGMVALEVSARNDECINLIFQCVTQELALKQSVTSGCQQSHRTFAMKRPGSRFTSFVRRLRTLVGSPS